MSTSFPEPPILQAPSLAETANSDAPIGDAEAQLSVLWRRSRIVLRTLAKELHEDLEPSSYGLLMTLYQQGPSRLTDLSSCLGVGLPSLSRQINYLETLELVAKIADPSDGRAQLVDLTNSARQNITEHKQVRAQALHERFAQWEPHEVAEFARLLGKFNRDFETLT